MSRRYRPKAATIGTPTIRAKRTAQRLTQVALADPLATTCEQRRKYEKGRVRRNARRLQEIAAMLRAPVGALCGPNGNAGRSHETSLSLVDAAGALRLMRAYAALPTPRMKRALVNLAERMAGVDRS